MLAIYRETDREVQERAASLGATCRKGCSDCCSLLISVTFPEAVAIAETLLTDPAHAYLLKSLTTKLHAQIEHIVTGIQKREPGHYFLAKQPCALLDPQTKTCSVYVARPSTCRLHYVVTDPAWCSPDDVASTVARLNMAELSRVHVNEACRAANQTATPLWAGPLQIMLLWAFKLLAEGRPSIEAAHAEPEKLGVMSLHLWRARPEDSSHVEAARPPEEAPVEAVQASSDGSDSEVPATL